MNLTGYGGVAMRGSLIDGFNSVILTTGFGDRVETMAPFAGRLRVLNVAGPLWDAHNEHSLGPILGLRYQSAGRVEHVTAAWEVFIHSPA